LCPCGELNPFDPRNPRFSQKRKSSRLTKAKTSNHPPSVAAATYGAAGEWTSAFTKVTARQANRHECCSVRCPQRSGTLRWGQRTLQRNHEWTPIFPSYGVPGTDETDSVGRLCQTPTVLRQRRRAHVSPPLDGFAVANLGQPRKLSGLKARFSSHVDFDPAAALTRAFSAGRSYFMKPGALPQAKVTWRLQRYASGVYSPIQDARGASRVNSCPFVVNS
jgi:hypothetical protein